MAVNIHYAEKDLAPFEQEILSQLKQVFPKSKNLFAEKSIQVAIERSVEFFQEKDSRIIDPRARRGICQIISYHMAEVLKDYRQGDFGVDLLLYSMLSLSDSDSYAKYLTTDLIKKNLRRHFDGFIAKSENLSKIQMSYTYDLLEAWLCARAIRRIVGADSVKDYMEQVSAKKKKHYAIQNQKDLDREFFLNHLKTKTLLIAYHDGIPDVAHMHTFNTVKYFWVLDYSEESQSWVFNSHKEEFIHKDDGFQIVRESHPDSPDSFVLSNGDPEKEAARSIVDVLEKPEEGKDYIVVHMGGFLCFQKDFDQSFIEGAGLDKVNFQKIFLGEEQENLPGSLSIFHFNTIYSIKDELFPDNESFEESLSSGFRFGCGGRSFDYRKNQSYRVEVYTPNPYWGDSRKNYFRSTLTMSKDDKHYKLVLEWERDDEASPFVNTNGYFMRRIGYGRERCTARIGSLRTATDQEYADFIKGILFYSVSDIAPAVKKKLQSVGMSGDYEDLWKRSGPEKWIPKGYDEYKDIVKRTKEDTAEELGKAEDFHQHLQGEFKTTLHNGMKIKSVAQAQEAGPHTLFKIFGLSREEFIQKVVQEKTLESVFANPKLIESIDKLIEKDMKLKTIDQWEDAFQNPYLWPNYRHLEVLAELFDSRIYLYQVETLSGEIEFVPLKRENDKPNVLGTGSYEMHLLVSNDHIVDKTICYAPSQFVQIFPLEKVKKNALSLKASLPIMDSEMDPDPIYSKYWGRFERLLLPASKRSVEDYIIEDLQMSLTFRLLSF